MQTGQNGCRDVATCARDMPRHPENTLAAFRLQNPRVLEGFSTVPSVCSVWATVCENRLVAASAFVSTPQCCKDRGAPRAVLGRVHAFVATLHSRRRRPATLAATSLKCRSRSDLPCRSFVQRCIHAPRLNGRPLKRRTRDFAVFVWHRARRSVALSSLAWLCAVAADALLRRTAATRARLRRCSRRPSGCGCVHCASALRVIAV